VVTDGKGKPMKPDAARSALIKQHAVAETDQEALAVIDAAISDSKPHTYADVGRMMPPSRYTPSGRRETAMEKQGEFGFHPLGFASHAEFQLFIHHVYKRLPVSDATVVFHGSSLSGQSFKDKGGSRLFDVGRDSDYDVAIASPTLWQRAPEAGVKLRGNHSEPLAAEQIKALGLDAAFAQANLLARREVNFMLYENEAQAHQHEGAALVAHQAEDYREGTGALHGDM
jgi:hypothetical protein